MHHKIIEIKARCNNHEKIRNILLSGNAKFQGMDHQIDTYFNVSSGRLKLREGNIENSLIHYFRDNLEVPKESDVLLYKPENLQMIKMILSRSLGVLISVDKEREIYFIDNVKFHIDKVKDLGKFVEIEAIGNSNADIIHLMDQCETYLKLFGIEKKDLITHSYSDMLLKKKE
jgi:adenylate cyclase, class 2